jgi:hypothetical protein
MATMGMPAPGGSPEHDHTHKQASLAFDEYKMVAEDTAKITDRRQTVNTLFVTINALFLTGVGYLLYLSFQFASGDSHIFLFALGFLAIALITSIFNRSWLRLSEQSRKLIDLRIRYLEQLEAFLRSTNYFPTFDTPLKGMDPKQDKEYEGVPPTFPGAERTHPDAGGTPKRWMTIRGTYSLEEVLYNNPNPEFKVFGFSRAEQRVGRTFTAAYWVAFAVTALAILVQIVTYYTGFHFTAGPFHF